MSVRLDTRQILEDLPPNIDLRGSLEELSDIDPLIFALYYRRLRQRPYIFDISHSLKRVEKMFKNKEISEIEYRKQLIRHRPFLIKPLRDQHPHKCYRKSRQMGVSENSVTEVLWFLKVNPNTKWIITFPREKQLIDFSNSRIREALKETPRIRDLIGDTDQTFTKKIGDSWLFLRSAWEVNLGEGIDADGVTFDEKDRMRDGVHIAFEESLQSSPYGYVREISTPTLPGRGIDESFQISDQQHWFVRCANGHWQPLTFPDSIMQLRDLPIGAKEVPPDTYRYACAKESCRARIDRTKGEWVAKYPDRKLIRGYQISQLTAPWISADKIYQKKIKYRYDQPFFNYCVFSTSQSPARVTTDNGSKPIHEVEVGEKVLTHKGRFRRVSEVSERIFSGVKVSIYVGQGKYPQLNVTPEHPFLVLPYDKITRDNLEPEWIEAGELREGDFLSFPVVNFGDGLSVLDVANYVRHPIATEGKYLVANTGLVKRSSKYLRIPQHQNFDEDLCLFLGLFLAEGNITGVTTVHHKDEKELIQFSHSMFKRLGGNPRFVDPSKYKSQKSQNALVVECGRTLILGDLFDSLYRGTRSEKRVPELVWKMSREQRLQFVAGYIVGDGRVHGQSRLVSYSSCSPHIAYSLQAVLSSLGYYVNVRRRRTHSKTWAYHSHVTGIAGTMLLNELQPYIDRFKVNKLVLKNSGRSYSIYPKSDRFHFFPIGKIKRTRVKNRKVYNFEVSQDHSYAVQGVMTHNCVGVPSVGGTMLVSIQDIKQSIAGHTRMNRRTMDWNFITIGIDWGHLNWLVVRGINAHNGRQYILDLKIFEDQKNSLDWVEIDLVNYIKPWAPDMVVCDGGYGKDRNAILMKAFNTPRGRTTKKSASHARTIVFSCDYNPAGHKARTHRPAWSEENSRVLVNRFAELKGSCHEIKSKKLGLPKWDREMEAFEDHFTNLAPILVEDEDGMHEEISATGDDHFAHADTYSRIAMEKVLANYGSFSFALAGGEG